jgi:hypothetical protein
MDPELLDKLRSGRRELMRSHSYYDAVYSASPSLIHLTSWLAIPQNDPTDILKVLYHNHHRQLFLSSIIGIVNLDDLAVDPHGDCLTPSALQHAALHLSLSKPMIDLLPYDMDFELAVENLALLYQTTCQPHIPNTISGNPERIHFTFPLFQKYQHRHEVSIIVLIAYPSNVQLRELVDPGLSYHIPSVTSTLGTC